MKDTEIEVEDREAEIGTARVDTGITSEVSEEIPVPAATPVTLLQPAINLLNYSNDSRVTE